MRPYSVVGRLLATMLVALAVATILAESARFGWIPELAVHFRPQYVAALALLAAAAVVARRYLLALGALAVMIPNLWSAGPYLMPWVLPDPSASRPAGAVSLVSLNLLHRNVDHHAVRQYLVQERPDVLVLSELTAVWRRSLRPVLAIYPYSIALDREGAWGLGVFSRFPLIDPQTPDLGVAGSFNVIATVAFPGGPVRLAAAHLSSPTSPGRAAKRNRQLVQLAQLLREQEPAMPRLLVGDLNITPFSPLLQDLLAHTDMHDARRAQGLLGTWPRWLPLLLQIPIDHCIADPALAVTSVTRGPGVGSDHYPLEIRLRSPDQREIPP